MYNRVGCRSRWGWAEKVWMMVRVVGMMWMLWVAWVELKAVEAPWVRMCMGVGTRMCMVVCPSCSRTHM